MPKFKRTFGDNPEDVAVLNRVVTFNEEGIADVDDEVAEVLAEVPGYEAVEVIEKVEAPAEPADEPEAPADEPEAPAEEPSEEDEEESEEASEEDDEEVEEEEKPKKPATRARKSPARR